MASSSTPKKCTKRAYVKNAKPDEFNETNYLESWFVGNYESMEEYNREVSRKVTIAPKVLKMLWLKEEKLDDVREALRFQKLEKFVRLSRNVYLDLVKKFLTNIWSDEEAIYSQVKGIDIFINDEVWLVVAGLRYARIPIGKNNTVGLEMFNKAQFFKSCLRNPNNEFRSYSVARLVVTPRILAFIVIWMLTSRGFNHVVLIEEDLMIMYCLIGKIQVNWISVIKEHLIKIRKKVEYKIPYVVLISQFIEYFEIDTKTEVMEKAQNEIGPITLNKIGLTKVNDDHWICKADYDSSEPQPVEEDDNGGTSVAVEGYEVLVHDVPHTRYENYFASFEESMMTQLHTMHEEERNHYQYCETKFQHTEGSLEDVQNKLGHMFFNPDD